MLDDWRLSEGAGKVFLMKYSSIASLMKEKKQCFLHMKEKKPKI